MDDTRVVAENCANTIVLIRTIDASRARVFDAWTQPEQVSQWWDPAGRPLAACAIDLRPGGVFSFVNDRDTNLEKFEGVYVEVVPPERIVFEREGLLGTVLFNAEGQRTQLVVIIECRSPAERDRLMKMGVGAGTARTVDNLARHLGRAAVAPTVIQPRT